MTRLFTRTLTMAVLGTMLAIGSIAPAFAQTQDASDEDDLEVRKAQRKEQRNEQQSLSAPPQQAAETPERDVPQPRIERSETRDQRPRDQSEGHRPARNAKIPEPIAEPRERMQPQREERRVQARQRFEDAGTDQDSVSDVARESLQRDEMSRRLAEQRNQAGRNNNDQREQAALDVQARAEARGRFEAQQRPRSERPLVRGEDLLDSHDDLVERRSHDRYDDRGNREGRVGSAPDHHDDATRQRLSHEQQRRLIDQQRQHAISWQHTEGARRSHIERHSRELQHQQRHAQSRHQRDYYRRWLAQQARWNASRYNYYNDPYYYTASNYRYGYGGRWYNTNQYGANLLRQAVRDGYQEGYYAGRADRQDHWRFDYRNSYGYADGSYGYNGYYVSASDYRYYFRQGFHRGYDDAYYGQSRYGRHDSRNGLALILPGILSSILGFQNY